MQCNCSISNAFLLMMTGARCCLELPTCRNLRKTYNTSFLSFLLVLSISDTIPTLLTHYHAVTSFRKLHVHCMCRNCE